MDIKGFYKSAKISRVAIIDDDLSQKITLDDIEKYVGKAEADVLRDVSDPDCASFISILQSKGIPCKSKEDRASALSIPEIRLISPDRIREAADMVLSRRQDMLYFYPVLREWIKTAGVLDRNVKVYSHPDEFNFEADRFDLVFIDFLLLNDSEADTLRLIKKIKKCHEDQDFPVMFVLMSSHAEYLSEKYSGLRPELNMPASQIRVLEKPKNNNIYNNISWVRTLSQVAQERFLIAPLTNFISKWVEMLEKASLSIGNGLWGLDAHGLDILNDTAKKDHIRLEEYFSEILSRRVLAEVEELAFPKIESQKLEESINKANENSPIFPGHEICDSRNVLKSLLSDVVSHREPWWVSDEEFPIGSKKKLAWIKSNLQFGIILFDSKSKRYFINLTQACDLAHISDSETAIQHLLLLPGDRGKEFDEKESTKECTVSSVRIGSEFLAIKWFLRRPYTPSILEFMKVGKSFKIVGRLRQDQSQSIVAKYSSLSSRVALPALPQISRLLGRLCYTVESDGELNWVQVELGSDLIFHLMIKSRKNEKFLHIDPESCHLLSGHLTGTGNFEAVVFELLNGFSINSKCNIGQLTLFFIDSIASNSFEAAIVSDVLLKAKKDFKVTNGAPAKFALIMWRAS